MSQFFKNRGRLTKANIIFVLALMAGLLLTGVAYAQKGALVIYIKAGDPTELVADGKSQTRLMFDLSGCVWYPTASPDGKLQITFTSDQGTSLSPPSIFKTKGEVGSPFEVALKAGSQYGTAKVTASASFCSEGNIMLVGQCSSQQEQNNPECTGEFEIQVRPAGASEEGEESSEESEDTGEFGVSISCPPNPKAGTSVTCTANVSGAKQGESLDYFWSLEGKAGTGTKNNTFTWEAKETGYYEVSVEVFGKDKDRTPKNTLLVEVIDSEASGEEETSDESTSSESPEVSTLASSLEAFLKSAGVSKVNPARLAVAGTGISALIAIWIIVNHRAGVPMEKLEQAVGKWRWQEGQKVPKPLSGVEKKAPEKLPEKPPGKAPEKPPADLPEALKSDKAASPQLIIPEEEKADLEAKASAAAEGAQASASAKVDEPARAEPPAKKAASGETGEELLERLVDDSEDYRDAVDKTLSGFKEELKKVPDNVKNSEFWKQKVAPKLKKLDEMGIESKSGKLKEFLRIAKELLEVRKKVNADLSNLSKADREGIVWLERGLQTGEEVLDKLHSQLITDPAISAAKAILPKEQAAAAEKILKQHQADIKKMLGGIKKLPRKFAKNAIKASKRDLNVGIVKKDTNKVWESKGYKDKFKFDPYKSPKKLLPAIKEVKDAGSWVMKKLGRQIIWLRDTRPGQK